MKRTHILIAVVAVMLLGCSSGENKQLSGKFEGPAGSLEFSPEWQVKVDFKDENAWMIGWSTGGKNHATYSYRFTDAKGQIAAMDKAAFISYSKDGKFVHTSRIKVTEDQITFLESTLKDNNVMTKI